MEDKLYIINNSMFIIKNNYPYIHNNIYEQY